MSGKAIAYVVVSALPEGTAWAVWVVRGQALKRSYLCRGERCSDEQMSPKLAMAQAMYRAMDMMSIKWPDLRKVDFVSNHSAALDLVPGRPGGLVATSRKARSRRGAMEWCRDRARRIARGRSESSKAEPDISEMLAM